MAPRICYFGGYDPNYARNHFFRAALESIGCEVVQVQVPPDWPSWKKIPALTRLYWQRGRHCDALLVAEFSQALLPLAWLLARLHRQRLACDLLLSLWAANRERGRYRPGSLRDRRVRWIDRRAGRWADISFTLSGAYARMLIDEVGVPAEKLVVIPLSADPEMFDPDRYPASHHEGLLVQFVGSYVPNHGADVVVRAAALLRDVPGLRFRFIGEGAGRAEAERIAREEQLPIEFVGRVPFSELPRLIAEADIVLGVFGDTPQADQALSSKVLQGLLMRKPVVAGAASALREFFTDGEDLLLVPFGDPAALADALRRCAADPALRERLAQHGYRVMRERFSRETLGHALLEALELP